VILAVEIERYVDKRGLTQAKAAAAFGVPQPTISKIVRGNVSKLSLEFLLEMLACVGIEVQLVPTTRVSKKKALAA
jgi:predicted XRE-type DNA-binding protein